jgi:hypothetical protein
VGAGCQAIAIARTLECGALTPLSLNAFCWPILLENSSRVVS